MKLNDFKKYFGAAGILTASLSSNALVVEVDKGTLNVEFANAGSAIQVDYSQTQNCKATVKWKRNENLLKVYHSDLPCPQGANINLVLPLAENVQIRHGGGYISVKKSSNLLNQVSFLRANTYGVITSDVNQIELKGQYVATEAEYKSSESNLPYVVIKLDGGVINFEK